MVPTNTAKARTFEVRVLNAGWLSQGRSCTRSPVFQAPWRLCQDRRYARLAQGHGLDSGAAGAVVGSQVGPRNIGLRAVTEAPRRNRADASAAVPDRLGAARVGDDRAVPWFVQTQERELPFFRGCKGPGRALKTAGAREALQLRFRKGHFVGELVTGFVAFSHAHGVERVRADVDQTHWLTSRHQCIVDSRHTAHRDIESPSQARRCS